MKWLFSHVIGHIQKQCSWRYCRMICGPELRLKLQRLSDVTMYLPRAFNFRWTLTKRACTKTWNTCTGIFQKKDLMVDSFSQVIWHTLSALSRFCCNNHGSVITIYNPHIADITVYKSPFAPFAFTRFVHLLQVSGECCTSSLTSKRTG